MNQQNDPSSERQRMRVEYGELFDRVAAILFSADPVGINFEDNTDEYEPEAASILARLPNCRSEREVQRQLHEVFINWFDADTAGSEERYTESARQIWDAWRRSGIYHSRKTG